MTPGTVANPPIFIAEGRDLIAFPGLSEAEEHLEVVDVDAGIFSAWDSSGAVLALRTAPGRLGTRAVVISIEEPIRIDGEAIR